MASSRQKKTPPRKGNPSPKNPPPRYADWLQATIKELAQARPPRPRRYLRNLKIERISFVNADDPSVEPAVLWQLPRGPGRPRSITLEAFRQDLAGHPVETIYRRAKRLGIDRQTVKDRLKEATGPKARVPFELRGPIVLIK